MAEEDLRENPFRDEIYDYLLSMGYCQSKRADYDYQNAIDKAKLFEFLESSQKEQLKLFKATHGKGYKERFIKLLNDKINSRGLLQALHEQIEDYSSSTKFFLAFFKPNLEEMNDGFGLYDRNILSVHREFAYEDKEDSFRVDLAIFLNGIPIVMIELKKQTAGQRAGFEGTKQFKYTRNPDEPIFSFNRRTLVYLAMDEFEAFVSTRLDKKDTLFLPFNKGAEDEGAGNPIVEGQHCTHYVWEEILRKDMLLKIIREFMFIDDEGIMIFPRYHQLDAVLKIEADVRAIGIGGRYLVWHSAGSGKTKTIAWLAKRLINLPEIDTVVVISDRNVIDSQLGNEITTVDGKKGVARWIENNSAELLKAIQAGGYIVVTTLQKFPFILQQMEEKQKRKFAIIIDEAHSSAAGKTLSKVSETLSGKSLKDAVVSDEAYEEYEDSQGLLLKQESRIKSSSNISYFAFTATPKTETMELFGSRKEMGKQYFHKYAMKQAIQEGFILNPLAAYTTYNEKFEIKKKKDDNTEYESSSASAAILNYITSSDEVIDIKTEIIMKDFISKRIQWLSGKGKAMLITPSRKHAVCYKLAIDKYIEKNGYAFKAVAAFTGTIEIEGIKYTEENMNAVFKEKDIKKLISNNENVRIIVVADKLQTGFDETKLCILYVDKKLNSAVKAVQTLSRINRASAGKKTFILDFVNKAEEIKAYFKPYLGGELYLPPENETDPNLLFVKRDKLLDYYIFTIDQADRAYALIKDGNKHSGELTALFAQMKQNFNKLKKDQQKLFTAEISKFVKLFYYISTVYNTWNNDMKRLAVFLDALHNVLYQKASDTKINPDELVELVVYSAEKAVEDENLLGDTMEYSFDKISTESVIKEKSYSLIDEIIERINTRYGNYENASKEFNEIVDTLSNDNDMIVNIRDSSPSAYEAEAIDKIGQIFVNGILSSDEARSQFFAQISSDKDVLRTLAKAVIRRIQDGLIAS
ncbi:MAG: DEAD/DEAH box helicase family protein [Syntrophomonadaceae bacterium]|nr:DEAD/DEAH box helicase family protein [Syntrophomonadaceae bacterium]